MGGDEGTESVRKATSTHGVTTPKWVRPDGLARVAEAKLRSSGRE